MAVGPKVSQHRPAQAPVQGPARKPHQPWTKQRVKATAKAGEAQVKKDEAARAEAGRDMKDFGSLPGVAKDRERLRQRALTETAPFVKRLGDEVGASTVRSGLLGGGSSYAGICKAFGGYRKALTDADLDAQREALTVLSGMVPLWLNDKDHRGQDPATKERRKVLQDLADKVARQQSALDQQEAQERYLAANAAGVSWGSSLAEVVPDTYQGRFEHLTTGAKVNAFDALRGGGLKKGKLKKLGSSEDKAQYADFKRTCSEYGISNAEAAAIYAYTDANYFIMNPGTANSEDWLRDTLDRSEVPQELKLSAAELLDPKALGKLIQEGSAHASVTMKALAKLPPFKGTTYRAQSRALTDEASLRLKPGEVQVISTLTSTSKKLEVTGAYAAKATPTDVLVLWEYQDLGKDVEPFSLHLTEREVLVPIGERVRITSVTQLQLNTATKGAVQKYARSFVGKAGKVFVVQAVAVAAPAPPARRWGSAKPTSQPG